MNSERSLIFGLRDRSNSFLDSLVRPSITILGKGWSTYLVCVNAGVVLGTVVIYALALYSRLPPGVFTWIVVMVGTLSWLLFRSTSIVGKSYPFVRWAKKGVYHFQIVALVFTVGLLRFLDQPILRYLDVLVTGMLVYQAFGRFGCLMAGCCHGKPHGWGVRYGERHAATGYPYFTGMVRLFPLQLIEAIWLLLLGGASTWMILAHSPAGDSLSWYIVGYGAGRFVFEFCRGDTGRVYLSQLSEPQWTALLLCIIVAALEWAGVLSLHQVHTAVPAVMAFSTLYLYLRHYQDRLTVHRLMRPDHILEVFQAVSWISRQTNSGTLSQSVIRSHDVLSGVTSMGIHITGSSIPSDGSQCQQYCLWSGTSHLERAPALVLARLIIRLQHPASGWELSDCGPGIHRLQIRSAKDNPRPFHEKVSSVRANSR